MTLQLSDPLATPKIPTWIDDVEASDATFGIVTRRRKLQKIFHPKRAEDSLN